MQGQRRAVHALGVALAVMVLGALAVFGPRMRSERGQAPESPGSLVASNEPNALTSTPLPSLSPAPVDREVKLVGAPTEAELPVSRADDSANELPAPHFHAASPADPLPEATSPLATGAPEEVLAEAHAMLVPEPADAAESFLAKSRAEAEQSIAALQAERDSLSTRMQKVEAGLARWKAVLEALKAQSPPAAPSTKPDVAAPDPPPSLTLPETDRGAVPPPDPPAAGNTLRPPPGEPSVKKEP